MAEIKKKLNEEPLNKKEKGLWEQLKEKVAPLNPWADDPEEVAEVPEATEPLRKAVTSDKTPAAKPKRGYKPAPTAPAKRLESIVETYQLRGEEAKALKEKQKEFNKGLEHVKEKIENSKDTQEKAKLVELVGQALVQLFAGARGLKTGHDMSGLKFNRTNWDQKMSELNRRLSGEVSELKQQSEAEKGEVRAEFRDRRADAELRGRMGVEEAREFDRRRLEDFRRAEDQKREDARAAPDLEKQAYKTDLGYKNIDIVLGKAKEEEKVPIEDLDRNKSLAAAKKLYIKTFPADPTVAAKRFDQIVKAQVKDTSTFGGVLGKENTVSIDDVRKAIQQDNNQVMKHYQREPK